MHAFRYARRWLTLAAALLTMTACASAATAAPAGTTGDHKAAGSTAAGSTAMDTAKTTPGWRVVHTYGPDLRPVSGLLAAVSANDAWATWFGSISVVEHWTGSAWRPVTLPPKVAADVFGPVAIGADAMGDVWLFSGAIPTEAVRLTGGKWVAQPIPAWVLRPSSGTISATTAVFGPHNVWVFSLGAGAYAAHYDGHTWAKIRMPEVPLEVSAQGPDGIWALGPDLGFVMRWNGVSWVKVGIPLPPLSAGAKLSYSNITAVGPQNAWLMRSIRYPKRIDPYNTMMHWNGKAWLTPALGPADIVGSLVPDGHGGLWADGININPGGFWYIYHLASGHWTMFIPPGVFIHSPEDLTWIPGTRSLWATGSNVNSKGQYLGVLLKYGP